MIYTTARWADVEQTIVRGEDADGASETLPYAYRIFRVLTNLQVFLANGGVIAPYVEPEPQPVQQILGPISAATLSVESGEITGVETSINFAFAFMIDTDKYWVFYTIPEPDTNYLVLGNVPFVRYADYLEITAPDHSEVAITTWRVG